MTRAALLADLSRRICALGFDGGVRVAVDGVDASGKTTLADELVAPLLREGHEALRISADDFLNPAEVRYRQGRDSADGFYRDSFDYDALRAAIERHSRGRLVIVDGIFLLRPELRALWQFSIFLRASFDVTVARAIARDAARLGGVEAARERYTRRYVPGQRLYFDAADPERHATVVIDNSDLMEPFFVDTVGQ